MVIKHIKSNYAFKALIACLMAVLACGQILCFAQKTFGQITQNCSKKLDWLTKYTGPGLTALTIPTYFPWTSDIAKKYEVTQTIPKRTVQFCRTILCGQSAAHRPLLGNTPRYVRQVTPLLCVIGGIRVAKKAWPNIKPRIKRFFDQQWVVGE